MKRIILFFVFVNFLLLSGGQFLNASTIHNSATHNLEKKHNVKITNQEQGNSIIEDADFDFEEDSLGKDGGNNKLTDKFFTENYSLLHGWYLTFSAQNLSNDANRFKIFVPLYGQSNPIYITQRVLRI